MEHAHELPEFLHFLEEIQILRGFVFGFTHTCLLYTSDAADE